MSKYFSFELVAAAWQKLQGSSISSTDLSALRYCLAFDAFVKRFSRDCSLKKGSKDRDVFIGLVEDVVAIDQGDDCNAPTYVNGFEGKKPSKRKLAQQVSSNFITVNAVRASRGKAGEPYPSGEDKYLFTISDEVLDRSSLNYEHVRCYLKTPEARAAFAIWAARYNELPDGCELQEGLRAALGARYSQALVNALLGSASNSSLFGGFADVEAFASFKPQITWSKLFPADSGLHKINMPFNWIFFGAPGTGKSYELSKVAGENFPEENISRVTFYPDYTYSQFVGCFKPVIKYESIDNAPASKPGSYISYEFVPGPFLSSYVKAVQNPDENYLLIVEEINRANPAAVFGDVFQLLDRKATGESEYEIAVPREMQSYLEIFLPEYATTAHITEPVKLLEEQERLKKESGRLALPSNLYIWATMNSADQGVFPMDTAFKRRWDFRYIGIDAGEDASVEIDGVKRPLRDVVVRWGKGGEHRANWNNLRKAINDFLVSDKVKLNEDKLLGPFFAKPETLTQERFAATFKDKVLLYLYEDACKTKHSKVFASDLKTYSQICDAFDERGVDIFVDDFKKYYSEEADDGSKDDGEAEE